MNKLLASVALVSAPTLAQAAIRELLPQVVYPSDSAITYTSGRASGQVDLDGDGELDAVTRSAGAAQWTVTFATGNVTALGDARTDFGSGQAYAVGDFDGDGRDEIAWRRARSAFWTVNAFTAPDDFPEGIASTYSMNDGRTDFNGASSQVWLVDDFDGDGADEIAWRRNGWDNWKFVGAGGSWNHYDGLGASFTQCTTTLGLQVGDFDSNGAKDIAWRKANTATWYLDLAGGQLKQVVDADSDFVPGDTQIVSVIKAHTEGHDVLVWRKAGRSYWRLNFAEGHNSMLEDGQTSFDPANAKQSHWASDYDHDGLEDIAWGNSATKLAVFNYSNGDAPLIIGD